jgi:2-polyprenyl-3-methyl-5-hydroxy-6-metoxy-1,4-benzoquinol methylase
MVYVAEVIDDHAIITDGPVAKPTDDPAILASSRLDDIRDRWELDLLPSKEAERPALRQNAVDALDRLDKLLQPVNGSRRVLDFGSGWGFFLGVAKERGWESSGIEPLPAPAVYARASFDITVVTDTLRDGLFPPGTFDAITAFQVFEHLPTPKRDLTLLARMLRAGGVILIEVPNIHHWTVSLLGARHRHFVQDHLNFFSEDTLSDLLTSEGFIVETVYYPTRRMTVRHLTEAWGRRFLPEWVPNAIRALAIQTGVWERIVSVNIGDIVAVIARKRD